MNTSPYNFTPVGLLQYYSYDFIGKIFSYLPYLLIGLIFIILGYLIAWFLEFIIRFLVSKLNINKFLSDLGFSEFLKKSNIELKADVFLGKLVFWIVFLVFLMAAFDVLGLTSFSNLLNDIIKFLPKLLVSSFIFIFAVFVGDLLKKIVYSFLRGIEIKGAEIGSEIVYYGFFVFGLILALSNIGIATEILNILIMGIVLAISLALGLSFGLGGQELAKHFLDELRKKIH
jgi:hypothetical protein